MKMKKVMALALAGVMALSIAACGGGSGASTSSGSGSADAGSASSGALTINIWDANQQAGIQEICNDWTALGNPEVKVEVIDWDNYWTLLEAGASGGQLADVFWMHSDYAQIYMENDILLDLTDYIAKDGVDMSIYYPDIAAIYTRRVLRIRPMSGAIRTCMKPRKRSQRELPMMSTATLSIRRTTRTAGTTTFILTAEML